MQVIFCFFSFLAFSNPCKNGSFLFHYFIFTISIPCISSAPVVQGLCFVTDRKTEFTYDDLTPHRHD